MENMKNTDITLSTLSLNIKFCRYCCHDSKWCETKTKSDYTIWNIYEGSMAIEINGKLLTASAGDVLFFKPGETYRAYCTGDCCNFLVSFFTIDLGNHINILESTNVTGIYHSPKIKDFSDAFCKEYLHSLQMLIFPSLKLYAAFFYFFAQLWEHFGTQICFQYEIVKTPVLKIHKLLKYMDEHFTENIPIKDLAAFMGMNEKYFINYFHTHIGKSPKQYLVDCRMKYSLELLADSANSLSDVASALNFSDQYAFAKAFKKYYGEAPGNFRKHYSL